MKKTIIIIVSILVVGGIGALIAYQTYLANNAQPEYLTTRVEVGDVKQTVEASGSVNSAEEFGLSFETQGTISRINVDIGDEVEPGDLLAAITDNTLLSEVDRARAELNSAEADLEALISGATQQEINVSLQKVQRARIDLAAATQDTENAEEEEDTTRETYKQTALQYLTDASFVIQFSLDTVYDAILDAQADAEFNTSNTGALNQAEADYGIATGQWQNAKSATATAVGSQNEVDILNALQVMRSALNNTSDLLDSGFEALSGAIANANYTQTVIDGHKTDFNSRASAVASEKTSIQTSINNLTTGILNLQTAVDKARAAEDKAEEALALAQAEYQLLIADPQSYEVKNQQARILQAQASLRSAESKLDDTVIRAPVRGVITRVDYEVGELASPSNRIITMIGENRLQIDVDIPESDINKIVVGQEANITLDAFGIDRFFDGSVSFIEPSETLIQDVVYYRVTVLFGEEYEEVKPGMTADVTIPTALREDVLMLPIRAVAIAPDGTKTVRVLRGGQAVTIQVTTGIRGDEGTVEILSGLTEDDIVITGERRE